MDRTESDEGLLVGSFNIQNFGRSDEKDDASQIVSKILARYDFILVKEVSHSEKFSIQWLVGFLNDQFGDVYDYRIGSTCFRYIKEKYGFVYRKDKIGLSNMSLYEEQLHRYQRQPLVVRLNRKDKRGKQKGFTFIAMHTKPQDPVKEIRDMTDVYKDSMWHCDSECLIVCNLDTDCNPVRKSKWDDAIRKSDTFNGLPSVEDNTTVETGHTYERIMVAGDELLKNACNPRIFRFDQHFNIDSEQAKRVSDQYPIELRIE
uniref:Endonuclease/exonuclease/phosphatase domain-containing protein n=1 Tax=Ciona savignyi TaxID=51511 RepID=H2YTN6_CIOSA